MTCGDENIIYFELYKIKRNRKNKTKTISSHKGLTIIYYSREELKIFLMYADTEAVVRCVLGVRAER